MQAIAIRKSDNGFAPDKPISGSRKVARSAKASRLSFYKDLPDHDIEVDDFEEHAIARLHVLRRIDVLRAQGITGERFVSEIIKVDNEHLFPFTDSKTTRRTEDPKRDHISHFVLRMAYCQTEELRRWFLTNECQLFAIRFNNSKEHQVDAFLDDNDLRFTPIHDNEKERLRPQLSAADSTITVAKFNSLLFYKVPFIEVLSLVSTRKAYLEGGFAYVSSDRILSIIEARFRASLSRSLAMAYKNFGLIEQDNRIAPLVRNLANIAYRYGGTIGTNTSTGSGENAVNAESVVSIFKNYLSTKMGHSDPKVKSAGANKMFVSIGTRKPNEKDRTCPIAGREHKSNTQKYTIFFDTQVMMQGCWDGCCQATNRHVFYQIHDGKCKKVGWNPPPLVAPGGTAAAPPVQETKSNTKK